MALASESAGASASQAADVSVSSKSNWNLLHTLLVILFPVAVIAFGMLLPPSQRLLNWLINLVLFLLFIIILGDGITGRWSGLLIDDRKKMSLSRLQTIAWTVLILSAFVTAALTNISAKGDLSKVLNIGIPQSLWILLGISTTALVGSPLVLSIKKNQPDQPPPGGNDGKKDTVGSVVVNTDIKDASWSDIFTGEEVSNDNILDLGKVQMFYFTVLLVFTYGLMLAMVFTGSNQLIQGFPDPGQGAAGLLGISQAAYLVNKAVPRPATGSDNKP